MWERQLHVPYAVYSQYSDVTVMVFKYSVRGLQLAALAGNQGASMV